MAVNKVMRDLVGRDNILHEEVLLLRKDQRGVVINTFQDLESVGKRIYKYKNTLKG